MITPNFIVQVLQWVFLGSLALCAVGSVAILLIAIIRDDNRSK